MMEFINTNLLERDLESLRFQFQSAEPFHFVSFDSIFHRDKAEEILRAYPSIAEGKWDGTTYLDQRNKFQKTTFESGSVLDRVFKELNSSIFCDWLSRLCRFESPVIADPELFGGGLHQSIRGAFLNVHVDYNLHPTTRFHRRLNVIVYMNKDWKDNYEGHLELWDLSGDQKRQIARISPAFNRCVIFETNETSFHGHPKPLNTPEHINRKSLATYYYTETRPETEIANDHNTLYVNTEGVTGSVRRLKAGVMALLERINKH